MKGGLPRGRFSRGSLTIRKQGGCKVAKACVSWKAAKATGRSDGSVCSHRVIGGGQCILGEHTKGRVKKKTQVHLERTLSLHIRAS